MEANWAVLSNLRTRQHGFNTDERDILDTRERYATGIAQETHYDTVLMGILFVLRREGLTETYYYLQATATPHEANARRGGVQLVTESPDSGSKAPARGRDERIFVSRRAQRSVAG